jgi:hypothetical protein
MLAAGAFSARFGSMLYGISEETTATTLVAGRNLSLLIQEFVETKHVATEVKRIRR